MILAWFYIGTRFGIIGEPLKRLERSRLEVISGFGAVGALPLPRGTVRFLYEWLIARGSAHTQPSVCAFFHSFLPLSFTSSIISGSGLEQELNCLEVQLWWKLFSLFFYWLDIEASINYSGCCQVLKVLLEKVFWANILMPVARSCFSSPVVIEAFICYLSCIELSKTVAFGGLDLVHTLEHTRKDFGPRGMSNPWHCNRSYFLSSSSVLSQWDKSPVVCISWVFPHHRIWGLFFLLLHLKR